MRFRSAVETCIKKLYNVMYAILDGKEVLFCLNILLPAVRAAIMIMTDRRVRALTASQGVLRSARRRVVPAVSVPRVSARPRAVPTDSVPRVSVRRRVVPMVSVP